MFIPGCFCCGGCVPISPCPAPGCALMVFNRTFTTSDGMPQEACDLINSALSYAIGLSKSGTSNRIVAASDYTGQEIAYGQNTWATTAKYTVGSVAAGYFGFPEGQYRIAVWGFTNFFGDGCFIQLAPPTPFFQFYLVGDDDYSLSTNSSLGIFDIDILGPASSQDSRNLCGFSSSSPVGLSCTFSSYGDTPPSSIQCTMYPCGYSPTGKTLLGVCSATPTIDMFYQAEVKKLTNSLGFSGVGSPTSQLKTSTYLLGQTGIGIQSFGLSCNTSGYIYLSFDSATVSAAASGGFKVSKLITGTTTVLSNVSIAASQTVAGASFSFPVSFGDSFKIEMFGNNNTTLNNLAVYWSPSPTFSSPNAAWTASSFTGSGDIFLKFFKSSLVVAGYTGARPSITVNRDGVVHVTADNVYYDFWWRVFRGSTKVIEYGSDSTPDSGGDTGSITNTFTVSVGDVITLGDPGDYNILTNVSIWWTPT